MSIQGAMLIAASSLQMQQRQSELIANNVANATTPGYVRRELPQSELVGGGVGMGVMAGVVQRLGDALAAGAANQALGAQGYSERMVDLLSSYVQQVGLPADSASLPSMLSAFSQSLTALSSTPESATAQSQAVRAAQDLADTFHRLDASIQRAREQADQGIASDVDQVNTTLDRFAQNEANLQQAAALGQSTAAFQDTRDNLLADLSKRLSIKTYTADNNGILVTTDQGTTLWDGGEHKLNFSATPTISAEQRLKPDTALGYTGGLSDVTVDGDPLAISQGGSIAANLQLRDVTLPNFSRQLDQLARNLITTFQTSDPTVAGGQTGVFTAAGIAVDRADPTEVPGLARKIAVNATLDPSSGGQTWRIRDGAQASSPGGVADNSTVLGFIAAMQQKQVYDTTTGLPANMSLGDAATQIAAAQQVTLATWQDRNDTRMQQVQATQTALSNATGVNVDEELERLMIVQHTYAASAQVLQASARMLDELNQLN